MTLLLILGAGASAGSLQSSYYAGWRPPLAGELFDSRFDEYLGKHGGAVAVAERVRTRGARGESLEVVLSDLQGREDPELARHLLDSQFYLQEVLWRCSAVWGALESGMNAYLTLVSELEDWRARARESIIVATFNYDFLLEQALSRRFGGWPFAKPDDYVRESWSVVKVHGSASWMEVTNHVVDEGGGITWDQLVAIAPDLTRTGEFIVAGPGTTQYDRFAAVPAIAIPAEPKARFVCPEAHLRVLRDALPTVDRVLCVGWRGADRSLLDLMRGRVNPQAETLIVTSRKYAVGPEPVSEEVVGDAVNAGWLAEAGLVGQCRVLGTGFWDFARRFSMDMEGFRITGPLALP